MKLTHMKKIISLIFVTLAIQPMAFAIPGIPEARIACPGKFYASVLFGQDYSLSGPRLNKFSGKANVMDSSNIMYRVSGHQVVNRVIGDPVFWIFTIRSGSNVIDVSLKQEHDNLRSNAYGDVMVNLGTPIELNCVIDVQLNGANAPKPPPPHPYPRFRLRSANEDPCDESHPPPFPRCR